MEKQRLNIHDHIDEGDMQGKYPMNLICLI